MKSQQPPLNTSLQRKILNHWKAQPKRDEKIRGLATSREVPNDFEKRPVTSRDECTVANQTFLGSAAVCFLKRVSQERCLICAQLHTEPWGLEDFVSSSPKD